MAKHESGAKSELEELRAEVEALKEREAKHWRVIENFLAKVGTYYNSEGQGAIFFVNRFVTGGANGVAITPNQGLIEQFGLPMKLAHGKDEKIIGPCWVPEIIPERTEEEIELFDSEPELVGANSKATA